MRWRCFSFVCSFQSTHPVRGATRADEVALRARIISIHAPREGCDDRASLFGYSLWVFQSTHPVRGATNQNRNHHTYIQISIHAPREGCDLAEGIGGLGEIHFNPRTP